MFEHCGRRTTTTDADGRRRTDAGSWVYYKLGSGELIIFEPHHEKTCFCICEKQNCSSASDADQHFLGVFFAA